ncbi:hypothetical protein AYI68_g6167 [Smittium mucronatum]|uniref:Uncharacterized protein n=1 Tax=Smittium mucronatum TaxID=133383 RepID=A0A1R0GS84_9FUNG|nr:hypothetical protein AYI68_g6167 [Smittium mucronatum]
MRRIGYEGIGLNSAMGMVMRNHELVDSSDYPYGFSSEMEAWRELSEDLNPSVNFAGEPVMENLVSSFLGLSLSSGPNPPGAMGEMWIGGVSEKCMP